MSLHPEPIGAIPAETARVARAAFPKRTVVMRLREEFDVLYEDADFAALYPARGQPGLTPWRLALVTVFQFLEHLSDRQAADAVRARIDWKYALGLELTAPGFHFSVLAEFRARLVAGGAEHLLLDRMLERFKARGLVKARGKQRTDGTHVLAAVHDLHLLELVAETLRATLDDLAAIGLLPSEHFVDSAYVDAALLVGSRRDHGVSLEGPVRGVANRHTGAAQGFAQRDFTIDWERERVTCTRGKASVTWRAGLDEVGAPRIQAVFSRTDCGACAARELCTPAKAGRRSVYFHPRPEYEALNAARARMHDPAWKRRYRVRAGVEGTLSQGVRAFGMRRSRYIGLAKTGLQQACTGAAMNVSRAVSWLAGATRAKTRVTRFAALGQAA